MPRRKSIGEQFVDFLQGQLGGQVDVPPAATDVLRTTRFPGLESRKEPEDQYAGPDMGGFEGMIPGMDGFPMMEDDAPVGNLYDDPMMSEFE